MKKIKRIIASCTLMLFSLSLTGCWNSRELNTLGFITAMGLDKTETGYLLTVQMLNTRAIASQKSVLESPVVVYTDEGNDYFEMLRRMVTKSPRKLNVSHLSTVVFGEEFAKSGISGILDFLSRDHEFRSDFYFVITKGLTANSILNSVTSFETISAKKLESGLEASKKVWAASKPIKKWELVNCIISDGNNPVISGITVRSNDELDNSIDSLKESKADPIKLLGLAVLKNDKLVGWFDENESKGYSYITNNVKDTIGYVEDPSIGKITFETIHAGTKCSAYIENGKPAIQITIKIDANIAIVEGDLDVTKETNLQNTNRLAKDKISRVCYQSIAKAKELKSDVFGFGDTIHRAYPALWKELKTTWEEEFEQLPVNVQVKFNIINTGTISKSLFAKDKE